MTEDAIVKVDNGITNAENTVGTKANELTALVSNVVTHLNNLLTAIAGDVKIGISAAENGIGGTANLIVTTEDLLKATATQAAEPLATPLSA